MMKQHTGERRLRRKGWVPSIGFRVAIFWLTLVVLAGWFVGYGLFVASGM